MKTTFPSFHLPLEPIQHKNTNHSPERFARAQGTARSFLFIFEKTAPTKKNTRRKTNKNDKTTKHISFWRYCFPVSRCSTLHAMLFWEGFLFTLILLFEHLFLRRRCVCVHFRTFSSRLPFLIGFLSRPSNVSTTSHVVCRELPCVVSFISSVFRRPRGFLFSLVPDHTAVIQTSSIVGND